MTRVTIFVSPRCPLLSMFSQQAVFTMMLGIFSVISSSLTQLFPAVHTDPSLVPTMLCLFSSHFFSFASFPRAVIPQTLASLALRVKHAVRRALSVLTFCPRLNIFGLCCATSCIHLRCPTIGYITLCRASANDVNLCIQVLFLYCS